MASGGVTPAHVPLASSCMPPAAATGHESGRRCLSLTRQSELSPVTVAALLLYSLGVLVRARAVSAPLPCSSHAAF